MQKVRGRLYNMKEQKIKGSSIKIKFENIKVSFKNEIFGTNNIN